MSMYVYTRRWGGGMCCEIGLWIQQTGTKSPRKQLALAGSLCRTVVMQTKALKGFKRQPPKPPGNSPLHHRYKPTQTRTMADEGKVFLGQQEDVSEVEGYSASREECRYNSIAPNPSLAFTDWHPIPNSVFKCQ